LHGEIGFAAVSLDSGVFTVVFVEFFLWHHATCFRTIVLFATVQSMRIGGEKLWQE
jgi:hypothetical protein